MITAQSARCPECGAPTSPSDSFCPACRSDLRGIGWESDTFPGTVNVLQTPTETGQVIDGRYRILDKLGEGGMGTVYRVEHVRMGKVMALKLLRPDVALKKNAAERFRREARAVSKLEHPNIITVFDSGTSERGALYLVMEYVPGKDLERLIHEQGGFGERRALMISAQVLRALDHAHRAGIIHRDIKPGNVVLADSGEDRDRVKVLDFGLAKLVAEEMGSTEANEITGGAEVVGTPNCMSPEQARGLELDARSDLYSATALLFELLTGRPPFIGSGFEIVSQHLVARPPTLSEACPSGTFSDAVEAIVQKGLSKEPNDRFQSADEMCREVEMALGAPISAPIARRPLAIANREDWDAFERNFKRSRMVINVGVIVGLAGALAAGVVAVHQSAGGPTRHALIEEQEPNDQPSLANYIELSKPVIGRIGRRIAENVSDRDMFEFYVPEKGALSLEATGVKGVNLVVEIFATPPPGYNDAPLVAAVDDGPVSQREEMSDVVLEPGRYFVRLMDRRRLDEPDGPPRENEEDHYALELHLDPLRAFQEVEPNNEPEEAMPVTVQTPVLGKAGVASLVEVKRQGPAPLAPWSVDYYRLSKIEALHTACAVLVGIKFATLRVSALVPKEKERQLKPVAWARATDRGATSVCTKAQETVFFEVRLESGSTMDATYPIAFITEAAGGFEGLLALTKYLAGAGRAEDARALLERALNALPRAADAAKARENAQRL